MRILKFGLVLLSISLFVFACSQTETTKTTPANTANNIYKCRTFRPTDGNDGRTGFGKKNLHGKMRPLS